MRWSQHGDIDFVRGNSNKTAIQIFPLPIVLKLNSYGLPNTGQGVSGSHDVLFAIDIDSKTRCCFVAKLHTKSALKCVGWNHDVCLTLALSGAQPAPRSGNLWLRVRDEQPVMRHCSLDAMQAP